MRIVTRTEVAQTSINQAIAVLETELALHEQQGRLWREMPTVQALVKHLRYNIEVLKAIDIDQFGSNQIARDILFTMGYMPLCQCDECGSSVRSKFIEFGSDDHVFRVCFMCIQEGYDAADEYVQKALES